MKSKIVYVLFTFLLLSCSSKVIIWRKGVNIDKELFYSKVFSYDVYKQISEYHYSYYDGDIGWELSRVGIYNDFIATIDKSEIISVSFSFDKRSNVRKVTFYYKDKPIDILNKFNVKKRSGFGLMVRSANVATDEYFVLCGMYFHGNPVGVHYSYSPIEEKGSRCKKKYMTRMGTFSKKYIWKIIKT